MPNRMETIIDVVAGKSRQQNKPENGENADDLLIQANPNANAITNRLKHAIETGVFADGDQFPPERQLAVALGTARSTVRKALDQLEQKELVVRRVGSGTFVNYSGPLQEDNEDVADLISPLQLIETRNAVEPYMTRLAAIHATSKDINHFEDILQRIESCGNDQDQFTAWDAEFHLQVAKCARNPLMMRIYQQINAVRAKAQWNQVKRVILTHDKITNYNNEHRQIFEAIKQRDVAGAVETMGRHLDGARQDLIGANDEYNRL